MKKIILFVPFLLCIFFTKAQKIEEEDFIAINTIEIFSLSHLSRQIIDNLYGIELRKVVLRKYSLMLYSLREKICSKNSMKENLKVAKRYRVVFQKMEKIKKEIKHYKNSLMDLIQQYILLKYNLLLYCRRPSHKVVFCI